MKLAKKLLGDFKPRASRPRELHLDLAQSESDWTKPYSGWIEKLVIVAILVGVAGFVGYKAFPLQDALQATSQWRDSYLEGGLKALIGWINDTTQIARFFFWSALIFAFLLFAHSVNVLLRYVFRGFKRSRRPQWRSSYLLQFVAASLLLAYLITDSGNPVNSQQPPEAAVTPTGSAKPTPSAKGERNPEATAPPKPQVAIPTFELSGKVIKVTDGDTIEIKGSDGEKHKIRFHGIDTPEYFQTYGQEAKKALSRHVSRKTVYIDVVDTDRYGRTVGVVYVNGKNINLEMVCAGHAWWYERYAPRDRALKDCQRQARVMALGLWADNDPMPPWEYRRR